METAPKPNTVYESMHRIKRGKWVIRIWVTEADLSPGPSSALRKAAEKAASQKTAGEVVEAFRTEWADKPAVAAIEVLDHKGNGVVYYPDWS